MKIYRSIVKFVGKNAKVYLENMDRTKIIPVVKELLKWDFGDQPNIQHFHNPYFMETTVEIGKKTYLLVYSRGLKFIHLMEEIKDFHKEWNLDKPISRLGIIFEYFYNEETERFNGIDGIVQFSDGKLEIRGCRVQGNQKFCFDCFGYVNLKATPTCAVAVWLLQEIKDSK